MNPRVVVVVTAAAAACLIGDLTALAFIETYGEDPGPISFETIVRSNPPNDGLICPKSLCSQATVDMEPPVFTTSATELLQAIRAHASATGDFREAVGGGSSGVLHFVAQGGLFSAPRFVDVAVYPLSSGSSTVAIDARGGRGGRDENLQVASDWLTALEN